MIIDKEWTLKNALCHGRKEYEELAKRPLTEDEVSGVLLAGTVISSYTASRTLVPDAMGGIRLWRVGQTIVDIGWPEGAARYAPTSITERFFNEVEISEIRIPEMGMPIKASSMHQAVAQIMGEITP